VDTASLKSKRERAVSLLKSAGSVLVAYSGGVDSSLLLALAHEAVGDQVVAATAVSGLHPYRDRVEAQRFTQERGIDHLFFESKETGLDVFLSNGPDRCYHCKRSMFHQLFQMAAERGLQHVAHGANADDMQDYRPGLRAAGEMAVLSPLAEAGLKKKEVRFLSKEMDLPQWNKPSMACLATRIPYDTPITLEKLKMIEAAEAFLFDHGIAQGRVRYHGSVARIEVDPAGRRVVLNGDLREAIVRKFKEIGFLHVALDLEGYVSGSMNRALQSPTKE
jgi:uncharacterized protein